MINPLSIEFSHEREFATRENENGNNDVKHSIHFINQEEKYSWMFAFLLDAVEEKFNTMRSMTVVGLSSQEFTLNSVYVLVWSLFSIS